jgi:hypothetical protein
MTSKELPAGAGTTIRTGFEGQLWANTGIAVIPTKHTLNEAMAFCIKLRRILEGFKVVSIWKNKSMLGSIIQVRKLIGVRATLN